MLETPSLEHEQPLAPPTEGIKYAGSKLKLLPYILQLTKKANPRTVFDGFSGTTRVSQAFARTGHRVIANDIAVWSETFGRCYLLNRHPRSHYQALIDHLNAMPEKDGWFAENYGGDADGHSDGSAKRPWQRNNARKLDGIRVEIDRLRLSEIEKAVALTSLILALDEVDNTMGHYASYLSEWSPRSYKTMTLKVPKLTPQAEAHQVLRGDIFDILPGVRADLAYLDPPYGSNNDKMPPSRVRYGAYYHLWATVCLNDEPELFGKANRRSDSSDNERPSVFEEFRKSESGRFIALEAIERLLKRIQAPFILLSYSSGGRATSEELRGVIESVGRLREAIEVDYKRNVMGNMRWTHEWVKEAEAPNKEFLFLIEK